MADIEVDRCAAGLCRGTVGGRVAFEDVRMNDRMKWEDTGPYRSPRFVSSLGTALLAAGVLLFVGIVAWISTW